MAVRGWLRNEPEPGWAGPEVPPTDFERLSLGAPAPLVWEDGLAARTARPTGHTAFSRGSSWPRDQRWLQKALQRSGTTPRASGALLIQPHTHTNLKGRPYYYTHFADPVKLKHTEGKSSTQGHRVCNGKVMSQQITQIQSPVLLSSPTHWHRLDPWSQGLLTLWKNI